MKTLPRQPKPRQPLQDKDSNLEMRRTLRGQRATAPKESMESDRTVDLFTMIDDHLAWNMSASDLVYHSPDPPRPSSSGTMFVDFGADGELEVSFRNGVNKKLPLPPVPSKNHAPAKPASPRRTIEVKPDPKIPCPKQQRTETHMKPRPNRPSQSSRHDSVISPGANHSIDVSLPSPFPPPNRPLPPLPSRNPVNPQSRQSYPPQVHATSRSVSTTKVHQSWPAPSSTTNHIARDEVEGVHAVIEPDSTTVSYQSSGLTTPFTIDPALYAQAARKESRPESQTTQYFGVPSFAHRSSPNASIRSSASHVPLRKIDTNKQLPPLPPVSRQSMSLDKCSRKPGVLKEKKRNKVARVVKKVLRKIGV
ncbi:hypothetical protein N0V86_000572 [Didymella sp. IMI 355093]|nr:hypothetical protein N0V86_000572 [Didymella sp. IMI 355093]